MINGVSQIYIYLMVAIGGACGASLRFFLSQLILNWLGKGFPFATLAVNICGSFLMGVLYQLIEQGNFEISVVRTLIGVGFLGAFTTFSTFSLDTLLLLQQGDIFKATMNILLNVCLCLFAAAIGMFIVTHFNK